MAKKKIDLKGQKYGMLTVIEEADPRWKPSGQKVSMWKCTCECGNTTIVSLGQLRSGGTKSCGCRKHRINDITGQKFDMLTVICLDHISADNRVYWKCQCDCGNMVVKRYDLLQTNNHHSCGCDLSTILKEQYAQGRKSTIIDLTGHKFGRLTVVQRNGICNGRTMWLCKCDCGTEKVIDGAKLRDGTTTSCGCYARERSAELRLIDLTGQQFGNWTVIKRSDDITHKSGIKSLTWTCKCKCGTVKDVYGAVLRNGSSRSCGCLDMSRGEEQIFNLLNQLNVKFVREYTFDDLLSDKCFPLKFDFSLFNGDTMVALLEYQGEQHYYDMPYGFGSTQRLITDSMKKEYCLSHRIPLYEIKYTDDVSTSLYLILEELHLLHDNRVPNPEDNQDPQ